MRLGIMIPIISLIVVQLRGNSCTHRRAAQIRLSRESLSRPASRRIVVITDFITNCAVAPTVHRAGAKAVVPAIP